MVSTRKHQGEHEPHEENQAALAHDWGTLEHDSSLSMARQLVTREKA
jgi:hypothetical protein